MIETLVTPDKLLVKQDGLLKSYPVCYEFTKQASASFYVTNGRIGIVNPSCQADIDRFLLAAYLTLHKGKFL